MYRLTVEPIMFFAMFDVVMYSIISKEYLYNFWANAYGLHNHKSDYCNETMSPAIKELEAKVSAAASEWTLYLNIAGFLPSLVTTVIAGSWGDVVGRKPPLIVATTGLLLLVIFYMVTMHFKLPLYILLLGRFFCGLSGDFSAILGSCFAYLSDTSTHKARTFRVAVGEVSISVGGVTGSLISGVWVDAQGFVTPMWILVAGLSFTIFYILFLLPESVHASCDSIAWKLKKLCSPEPFVGFWNLLRAEVVRTKYVLSLLLCFFLEICVYQGISNTLPVFELSPPFCFSDTLVGYSSALFSGGFIIGIVFLKLTQGRIDEKWNVAISVFSSISSMLVLTFAKCTWLVFVGVGVSCLQAVSAVIFRSLMSRLVNTTEQGSVFSLIASADAIAGLASSFMFNGLYAATVGTFSPSIMLLAVGIDIMILAIFWFSYGKICAYLVSKPDEQNSSLINPDAISVNT